LAPGSPIDSPPLIDGPDRIFKLVNDKYRDQATRIGFRVTRGFIFECEKKDERARRRRKDLWLVAGKGHDRSGLHLGLIRVVPGKASRLSRPSRSSHARHVTALEEFAPLGSREKGDGMVCVCTRTSGELHRGCTEKMHL